MFIQTEATPNPATIKFLPGQDVLADKTAQFNSVEDAKQSPLAIRVFNIVGVQSVFLGSDFISVTKTQEANWDTLKTETLSAIMEHFVSGEPVMLEVAQESETKDENVDGDAIYNQIKELIDTRVRPAVAQDGGDIILKGFEGGVVKLELHGACSGCPSSTITLKNGIETMLKHYIPEVEAVEAVE